jgi:hypothetical protein
VGLRVAKRFTADIEKGAQIMFSTAFLLAASVMVGQASFFGAVKTGCQPTFGVRSRQFVPFTG